MADEFHNFYWQSHDALRLYARIYEGPEAASPTVLCLHGLTRNSRDFEELAPHLQKRCRVIVPDLRGRGFSERDPGHHYQPATYVQDVLALLAAATVTRFAVIGTSLGGILAMMLAFTHGPRVTGMVLNDVGPEIDPAGIERIKQYAGRMPPALTWNQALSQTQAVHGDAWPDLAAERWAVLTRRGYREDAGGILQVDADAAIGDAIRSAPAAPDLWPLWKALQDVPALAIRGARSDILSAATFARMKADKPNLQQVIVPNRGHVPLLDEPECLATIDAFLALIPN